MSEQSIQLPYGEGRVSIPIPDDWVLNHWSPDGKAADKSLSENELEDRLSTVFDQYKSVFQSSGTTNVVLAVPDHTRRAKQDRIVRAFSRMISSPPLEEYDVSPAILVATGRHDPPSTDELSSLVPTANTAISPDQVIVHDAFEEEGLQRIGLEIDEVPVRLNRHVLDADLVVSYGLVKYHYLAGFGGGGKMLCPGLGGVSSINAVHRKTLTGTEGSGRNPNVAPGQLQNNPMQKTIRRIARAPELPPVAGIHGVVTPDGCLRNLFSGKLLASQKRAIETYRDQFEVGIGQSPDALVVSPGGYPDDINLVQSHKALQHTRNLFRKDMPVLLVAECRNGVGSDQFREWLGRGDLVDVQASLRNSFAVYGQTAMALKEITETVNLSMVSDLVPEEGVLPNVEVFGNGNDAVRNMKQHVSGSKPQILAVSGASEYLFCPGR